MALGSSVVPDEVRGSGLALRGYRYQHRPPARLRRLRRAVDPLGPAQRDRVLRRGARGGDRAGRGAARPHAGAGAFLGAGGESSSESSSGRACWLPPWRRRARASAAATTTARSRPAPPRPCPRRGRPSARRSSSAASRTAARSSIAPAGAAGGKRTLTALHCDRVYFAGGRGLCLERGGGFAAGYRAEVFGPDLEVSHALGVTGIPSRARVSPDGRYGAVTLFVTGHSYADPGAFSTQTTLIDMATGHQDRRPRAVHRVPRQQAGHGHRRQLLGRDLRARQRPLLRHAGHRRQDLPDRGLGQRAPGARDPRERRVPVALARRHADRLQEAHRLGLGARGA